MQQNSKVLPGYSSGSQRGFQWVRGGFRSPLGSRNAVKLRGLIQRLCAGKALGSILLNFSVGKRWVWEPSLKWKRNKTQGSKLGA